MASESSEQLLPIIVSGLERTSGPDKDGWYTAGHYVKSWKIQNRKEA